MNMKIINKECYEILAEYNRKGCYRQYILRQSDVALLHTDGRPGFFELESIENFVDNLEKESEKDTETIKYFKEIIGVMRKYNRNAVIDELIGETSPFSLEGVSPLTLAC